MTNLGLAGERYEDVLSRSLNDLGIIVERMGEYDAAEEMYREALDIRMASLGEGHRSVGITANNLAVLSYRQAEYDSAVHYGTISVR